MFHLLSWLYTTTMMLNSILRLVAAVFIVPLGVLPALALTALIAQLLWPGDVSQIEEVPMFAIYAIPIAFAATVSIGIPLHLFLSWMGWSSYTVFATTGGLGALVIAVSINSTYLFSEHKARYLTK